MQRQQVQHPTMIHRWRHTRPPARVHHPQEMITVRYSRLKSLSPRIHPLTIPYSHCRREGSETRQVPLKLNYMICLKCRGSLPSFIITGQSHEYSLVFYPLQTTNHSSTSPKLAFRSSVWNSFRLR
jgi:hypothetical protein